MENQHNLEITYEIVSENSRHYQKENTKLKCLQDKF